MTISRDDLDQGRVDLSDVCETADQTASPVHPGAILRAEFLEPLHMSVAALARALGVSRPRLSEILQGRRGITADMALRLARYLGMSPQFWMNLQTAYDLDMARAVVWPSIVQEIQPRAA